jgi:hypothetical protein
MLAKYYLSISGLTGIKGASETDAICDSQASGCNEPEGTMLWQRGKAYSQDLREHVFAAADDGGWIVQIATLMRVSVSYVSHNGVSYNPSWRICIRRSGRRWRLDRTQ